MKIAKIISLAGALVMAGIILYALISGDFTKEGSQILAMPWGIVSLVDLYTGFILVSCWVFFREKSIEQAVIWTLSILIFGFLAVSVYVFVALETSKEDWARFFMGHRLPAQLKKSPPKHSSHR